MPELHFEMGTAAKLDYLAEHGLLGKSDLIRKSEAVAQAGITAKQFIALVAERVFPAPVKPGFWDRALFVYHLDRRRIVPSDPHCGYVYFLEDGEFVKIGWSASPHNRCDALQQSNPRDLILLAAFQGSPLDEGHTQRIFHHACHRGEWFHKSPGLLAYIEWLKISCRETMLLGGM